jgi:hypothetical protein
MDAIADLEDTVVAAHSRLLEIAWWVKREGLSEAFEHLVRPLSDEEARDIAAASISDAVANEPEALERFAEARQWLADQAQRDAAVVEARLGSRPAGDFGAKALILAFARARSAELPDDSPEDPDVDVL